MPPPVSRRTRLLLAPLLLLPVLTSPLLLIEGIYRLGLADAGEPPHPGPGRPLLPFHQALWAEREGGAPLEVQPLWPWTVAGMFGGAVLWGDGASRLRLRNPQGTSLAVVAARTGLFEEGANLRLTTGRWHLASFATAVALTRTFTGPELVAWQADHVEFAPGVRGLEAAAWSFFRTTPEALSWAQIALLLATQEGRPLDVERDPLGALIARNRVLDRLERSGLLTPAEAEWARSSFLGVRRHLRWHHDEDRDR